MNDISRPSAPFSKPVKKAPLTEPTPFQIGVVNIENKIIEKIILDQQLWGVSSHADLISRAVQAEQAAWRQNSKKTKNRGAVSGGGRKPWRQKGTGRARVGSIRSPIWRGGGVIFGPTGKENYRKAMNKKEFQLAFLGVLNQFWFQKNLIILQNWAMENPSTKNAIAILQQFKLDVKSTKALLVIPDEHFSLALSLRNLKNYRLTTPQNLSIYDLLNANKLIVWQKSLPLMKERFF